MNQRLETIISNNDIDQTDAKWLCSNLGTEKESNDTPLVIQFLYVAMAAVVVMAIATYVYKIHQADQPQVGAIPAGAPQIVAFIPKQSVGVSKGGEALSGVLIYKDGSRRPGKCAVPLVGSNGAESMALPLYMTCSPDGN